MDDERRQRERIGADDVALVTAVEREEAALVRRLVAEGSPRVGPEDVEAARLLSVILAASLDLDDEVADETAVRLLAHWPWDVVRRAVDLCAAARERGPATSYSDVEVVAEHLVEADRLATLRRRAREGDREAAAELVAIKRALRIASGHD